MYKVEAVENYRTFETDENGNELHLTNEICDVCQKPCEIFIKLDNGYNYINLCKTCICNFEQLWNKTFLENCKVGRKEV